MFEWAGVGPSAAGQENGWRGTNRPDLHEWSRRISEGVRCDLDRVRLSPGQLAEDCLIFGLRMNEGISLDDLEARFSPDVLAPYLPILDRLVADGLVFVGESFPRRHTLTPSGRLVADAVGAELLQVESSGV
jgi:coproporphyrinogen III oxidase-like Fe-S oxidoreductase